jgi:hypothetical protein
VRPRATILVKLLLAFVLPTVVLFAAFAVVAHEVTRRDLDDELGTRLEAIAAAAATHIRGKYLAELGPGDETERAYQNVMRKLESVAITTGADLFVFDRALDSRADTKGAAIGTHYFPGRARSARAGPRLWPGPPRALGHLRRRRRQDLQGWLCAGARLGDRA